MRRSGRPRRPRPGMRRAVATAVRSCRSEKEAGTAWWFAGRWRGSWQGAPLLCFGCEAAEALGLQSCGAGPEGWRGRWMGLGVGLWRDGDGVEGIWTPAGPWPAALVHRAATLAGGARQSGGHGRLSARPMMRRGWGGRERVDRRRGNLIRYLWSKNRWRTMFSGDGGADPRPWHAPVRSGDREIGG